MTRLLFAPDLVEEAVLLAEPLLALADRRAFRRSRDPLYDVADGQLRETERTRKCHHRHSAPDCRE